MSPTNVPPDKLICGFNTTVDRRKSAKLRNAYALPSKRADSKKTGEKEGKPKKKWGARVGVCVRFVSIERLGWLGMGRSV
jgi:hypothetical protein